MNKKKCARQLRSYVIRYKNPSYLILSSNSSYTVVSLPVTEEKKSAHTSIYNENVSTLCNLENTTVGVQGDLASFSKGGNFFTLELQLRTLCHYISICFNDLGAKNMGIQ